jgi:feruloyl esterase
VTADTAPSKQNLVVSKINTDATTALSRPLCKYPSYPRYNGTGDVNLSSSYTCSTQ